MTWYHHVGNRTSEIMRCKVYLEKSNGHVEVQLRAARVLAGCHSLGGESVKFCFWGLLSLSLQTGFRCSVLTCGVAPRMDDHGFLL